MNMEKVTQKEYDQWSKQASDNSPIWKNMLFAFLIGGLICALGQFFTNLYTSALQMPKDEASALTSVTLVFLASLLTGLNVYNKIAKVAGAGTFVPITGFSNAITSPAIDFKSEGYVLGLGAKMFVIAGPVIVYGISASVVFGVIYYLVCAFI